jgi:hypothetical protein
MTATPQAPAPFAARLCPAPVGGGLRDPDWWIWCGSSTRDDDGRYHLFASRWPRSYPWFTIGLTYEHPVIPPEELSNNNRWDSFARCVWWRLRIGMATAPHPAGPWSRPQRPTLAPRGIGPEEGFWDWGVVTNPAPFIGADGALYVGFRTTPDGNLGLARAETPESPFERIGDGPLLPEGFYVEDIAIWWNGSVCELLGKDGSGHYTGRRNALMHCWSPDLRDWRVAASPLVLDRAIRYEDGRTIPYARVERATVLLEDGRPRCLHCAVADGMHDLDDSLAGGYLGWRGSWNAGIPLRG